MANQLILKKIEIMSFYKCKKCDYKNSEKKLVFKHIGKVHASGNSLSFFQLKKEYSDDVELVNEVVEEEEDVKNNDENKNKKKKKLTPEEKKKKKNYYRLINSCKVYKGYRFHPKKKKWVTFPHELVFPKKKKTLTVVTYNILFDKYLPDPQYTSHRFEKIIEVLKNCKADVIGLQEIRKNFWTKILELEWVRNKFTLSCDLDSIFFDENGFGCVLLSKIPFSSIELYHFSRYRSFVIGRFKTDQFGDFSVACVHLSANYSRGKVVDSSGNRKKQMSKLYDKVTKCSRGGGNNMLIMGDFNFGDDDPREQTYIRTNFVKFVDVWESLKVQESGNGEEEEEDNNNNNNVNDDWHTYDTFSNPTAKLCSRNEKRKRFDRIFLNSLILKPKSITRIGLEVYEYEDSEKQEVVKYCASDHYGLLCKLKINA